MTYVRDTTDGAHALTHNQEVWADRGYGVISDGSVTAGSTDFELDISEHTVLVGDSEPTVVESGSVSVDSPTSDPYWAVVYINANGDVETEAGEEAEVEPAVWESASEIISPAPPSLADVGPVTVLGRALVEDNGIIDDERIVDRTFSVDRIVDSVSAGSADIDEATLGTLQDALDVNDQDLNNIANAFAELVETKVAKPVDRQYLPQYSNVANAPQEAPSIIEVPPGSATTPAGLYAFDEEQGEYVFVQGDVEVVSSGDLSDLNIDASRTWGGFDITDAGLIDANEVSSESASHETLEAESLLIGDLTRLEVVDTKTNEREGDMSVTFSFDNLSSDDKHILEFRAEQRAGTSDPYLRFNDDDGSNYAHWDESGTKHTGNTEIPLIEVNESFAKYSCVVEITPDVIDRTGVCNHPSPGGVNRIGGFTQAGGYLSGKADKIEITFDGWREDGFVRLWRVQQ